MSDRISGQLVRSNITGSVVIKTGKGRAAMLGIVTAADVSLHDCATVPEASVDNRIAFIPAGTTSGHFLIDMPFYKGLVAVAGAGSFIVSYT